MTESEAKTKWCPLPRNHSMRCLGSSCMAWGGEIGCLMMRQPAPTSWDNWKKRAEINDKSTTNNN